jgi:hypothetical protein
VNVERNVHANGHVVDLNAWAIEAFVRLAPNVQASRCDAVLNAWARPISSRAVNSQSVPLAQEVIRETRA